MSKYATFGPDGKSNGHFDDAIHAAIPSGAVLISDEQWQLSMAGRLVIDQVTGAPTELPERPSINHAVVDGAWVIDLDALYARQLAGLKAGCEGACRAGWTSSALGTPHFYETEKDRDQYTLASVSLAALHQIVLGNTAATIPVTCVDADGVKLMRLHTVDQVAQVGVEVQTMITTNKDRYEQLLAALNVAYDAGDDAAMLAVSW